MLHEERICGLVEGKKNEISLASRIKSNRFFPIEFLSIEADDR